MPSRKTHYEVLGVSQDASIEQLRKAHREMARRFHPDLASQQEKNPEVRLAHMREVNAAWKVLSDPKLRARYDASIERQPQSRDTDASWSPYPPGTEAEPPGGFTEWYADAALRRSAARTVSRPSLPARSTRASLLIGFGLLILCGILVLVVLVGPGVKSAPTSLPKGACVKISTGPIATIVSCDIPNDGQLVAMVSNTDQCPSGTSARRLNADDVRLGCLRSDAHSR